MRKRQKMKKGIDKKVFSNTATKTKAINLGAKIYRGGIRL